MSEPLHSDTAVLRVLVLHGPNLNLLGLREPGVYGVDTLDQINERIQQHAESRGIAVTILQSNHEGILIDQIHAARETAEAIVINPGAYTHYSHAIADAVRAIAPYIPTVEVHLSNVHAREEFRRHSVIAPAAAGQIAGFGADSYLLGLDAVITLIQKRRNDL